MPTIHFVLADGTLRSVQAQPGSSVMLAAIRNDVRGVEAECGGSCSCATCHVYVDPEFAGRLAPPDAMEDELLDGVAAERRPGSRLSCQIQVDAALDGLRVHIPPRQV